MTNSQRPAFLTIFTAHTQLLAICGISVLIFVSITSRGFLLPLYAAEEGAARGEIGLLFSGFAIGAAIAAIPTGMLIDRFGVMFVLRCSLFVLACSQIGLASTTQFNVILIFQFIGGMGSSASMSSLIAALIGVTPTAKIGRAMGILTFANQIGYVLGPACASVGLRWLSLRTEILLGGVLLAAILGASCLMGNHVYSSPGHQSERSVLIAWLRTPLLPSLLLALLGATMLWGMLEAYLPLIGTSILGLGKSETGFVIACQAVVNGLWRIPSGWFADSVRDRLALAVICIVFYAMCLAFIPHLEGAIAAVTIIISVAFISTAFVGLAAFFAELVEKENIGAATGVYVSALHCGLAFGPIAFGSMVERSGFGIAMTVCSISAASIAMLALIARYRARLNTNVLQNEDPEWR